MVSSWIGPKIPSSPSSVGPVSFHSTVLASVPYLHNYFLNFCMCLHLSILHVGVLAHPDLTFCSDNIVLSSECPKRMVQYLKFLYINLGFCHCLNLILDPLNHCYVLEYDSDLQTQKCWEHPSPFSNVHFRNTTKIAAQVLCS